MWNKFNINSLICSSGGGDGCDGSVVVQFHSILYTLILCSVLFCFVKLFHFFLSLYIAVALVYFSLCYKVTLGGNGILLGSEPEEQM